MTQNDYDFPIAGFLKYLVYKLHFLYVHKNS